MLWDMINLSKSKVDDERKEKEKKYRSKLKLITHFDSFEFDFNFNQLEFNKGFRQKIKEIEIMDLDALYLYSIFYINIFQKINDEKVNERCRNLKGILDKIDKRWRLVESKDNKNFNEEKLKIKLMARVLVLFDNKLRDFSRIIDETDQFKNEFVNLNDYTNIGQWLENKTNGYDEKNQFKKLILDTLPTCNQILIKQSSLGIIMSSHVNLFRSVIGIGNDKFSRFTPPAHSSISINISTGIKSGSNKEKSSKANSPF